MHLLAFSQYNLEILSVKCISIFLLPWHGRTWGIGSHASVDVQHGLQGFICSVAYESVRMQTIQAQAVRWRILFGYGHQSLALTTFCNLTYWACLDVDVLFPSFGSAQRDATFPAVGLKGIFLPLGVVEGA